ncbi:PREDICTED: T-complex protein 11-like protein 1 [Rhagoletis zephyria]|uniref:T-complex protein 11-like protein 1 n=1 Tax=Rhagoletis zephyria TaxID=28612 RepID=UPI0008112C59|nr:PREDICTED: T-complex protein 11-like protein 1 [Rhagoletis zephyria]
MPNKEESTGSSNETKEGSDIFYMETKADSETIKETLNPKRENGFTNDSPNKADRPGNQQPAEQQGSGENKRQRPTFNGALPALGISPPNFVSFEEIMKTANDMSRISLVNEIVFNKDFKIEKKEDESPLEKAVRENMHKAFWDILSKQLNESPPNYKQAISLLGEIKDTLLLFLMPQHVQLKNEINEILDLELINQQAENGIFESQRYAQYVLSLSSVEYEREKFKTLLETSQKYQIDVLEYTSQWLKRNYEALDLSQETNLKNLFNKILTASYIELLKCISPSLSCYCVNEESEKKPDDDYPETLLLIRNRIDAIRENVFKMTLISSVFVVTFAAIGEPLQSIKEFRMELKRQLDAIISPNEEKSVRLQYSKPEGLKSILTNVALQVIKSIEEALTQYQVGETRAPLLDEKKLESLKYQINELATPNSRIRSVMERRILEFIERVISSSTAEPVQVPSGLSSFASELTQVSGEFSRLVAYNRAVYSPNYTKIIRDIASEKHFITDNDVKEIEKTFYD